MHTAIWEWRGWTGAVPLWLNTVLLLLAPFTAVTLLAQVGIITALAALGDWPATSGSATTATRPCTSPPPSWGRRRSCSWSSDRPFGCTSGNPPNTAGPPAASCEDVLGRVATRL